MHYNKSLNQDLAPRMRGVRRGEVEDEVAPAQDALDVGPVRDAARAAL